MAGSRLSLRSRGEPPALRLSRQADALAAAGDAAAAAGLYVRALAIDPTLAGTHNNHGNALRVLGRLDEAAAAYRAAIARGLDEGMAHYNLASLLRQAERHGEADDIFRQALALRPCHAEAWNNWGNLMRDLERYGDAAMGYRHALALRPDWSDAHDNLGAVLYLLHEQGGEKEAAALARWWRRDHPMNPLARHIGAAIAGEAADARAPDDYVRQTFDLFAEEFDRKLADLDYRAPALLAGLLSDESPVPSGTLDVLDAGCGTGLCAAFLRPYARHLTGVDLSEGMLERADARGLYDDLQAVELVAFLASRPKSFDLAVAADVFCYFGALEDVFSAAGEALRPGGLLVFTVEELEPEDGRPYRVATHGRYAHTESYVRAALASAGWAPTRCDRDRLRFESGAPVNGLAVLAERPTRGV
ncbi:methyltransferase [Azospirillum picis]|uniref:TPR repeat methyltransferase n=1 Tax=Azospirillum picis TaxID=488438 RepID=A0ABU0MGU9_9PROT|nr:methyltransferase [Azospirillum picis]MBP2299081.1 putative TPR repeat methyltransferase [Azospirillum picis]MDQ0532677.1 putative TPR repeat methyltransferase [Azospirillum picis]